MDWAECSRQQEWAGIKGRFDWPLEGLDGFNCESGTTISDMLGAVAWLWTYPGDLFLRLPEVNAFFELDPLHTGGTASGLLTFFAVVFVIGFLGIALDAIVERW